MSFNPEATDSFARMQAPTPTAIQGRGDSPVANRTRDKTEPVSSRLREQANTLIDYWCGIQRSKCAQWDSLGPRALKEYAYLAGDLDQTEEDFGGAEMVPLEKRKDVLKCPFKFNEAWNHPCPFQRKQWREAIDKELKKMEDHKVWKKVLRSSMPKDRRCVKCRWIFEIKRNGIFRARLVACGYSQVPGQDFNEVYSPVVNDITVRILLIIKITMKLDSIIVDIETAFLHGDLKEEIFMDCPPGIEHTHEHCVLLMKTIYGLVQSARSFYKKLGDVFKSIGFIQSLADPCLFIKKTKKGMCSVVLWVDDCLFVGHPNVIKESIELL
jgi:hypothetical protein